MTNESLLFQAQPAGAEPDAQRNLRAVEGQLVFEGLRVALIGPLAPPAGGMAGQTRQLGELLRNAGAKVLTVRTNAPYRPSWIGGFRGVRALFRLTAYLAALWRAAGQAQFVHVMANSGWAWHLFAAPAIWVARLRRVPVLVNYRGGEAARFLARHGGLVRWSMRRASVLAVPSGFLESVFGQHGMPAVVLPNIVDLERFHPRTGGRGSSAHIVVTRNLEPIYDNASALHALALVVKQVPQARLTIAGSGPLAGELRSLAVALGLADRVSFAGRLDRDDVAALLREADVCLNPSLADNMPNSVLEALASGLPVVSTNVGGVPHIVRHEHTALLVPAGQPAAMADAVLRLLRDEPLWRRMSAAGLEEVQRYSWNRVAPVLRRHYESARHAR
jgi:glycosyltransferase involved in cell wall biosynthesis